MIYHIFKESYNFSRVGREQKFTEERPLNKVTFEKQSEDVKEIDTRRLRKRVCQTVGKAL